MLRVLSHQDSSTKARSHGMMPLSTTIEPIKQYCWDRGVGIELGRVIHWAILMLGPGADIELQRL